MLDGDDEFFELGEDWADDPEWAELWDMDDALIAEVIWDMLGDLDDGGYI